MQAHHIIKRPLYTEKGTHAWASNSYTFAVATAARKDEIKAAIQELYRVRVVAVNTVTTKSRNRRMKYGLVMGKVSKKAIVRVHPDDRIELA